jgi:archaellum component FlaC
MTLPKRNVCLAAAIGSLLSLGIANAITTGDHSITTQSILVLPKSYAQTSSIPSSNSNASASTSTAASPSVEQLQTTISDLQKQYNQLSNRTNNLERTISQLQQLDTATKSDFDNALNQLQIDISNSVEDRVGGLEGRIGGLEDRVGGLEGRIGGLEDSVASLATFDICMADAASRGTSIEEECLVR